MADALVGARWVLALVLCAAGAAKMLPQHRGELALAIRDYRLLPSVLVRPVARALPWCEITLGLLLATGVAVVLAAAGAAVIFGAFTFAVGWGLLHGRRFSCGCGSGGQISWGLASRDVVFAALAIVVAAGGSGGFAVWPGPAAQTPSASWQAQLPVPLITVLLVVALRVLVTGRRSWGIHPSDASSVVR